jgi:hypothetical protein
MEEIRLTRPWLESLSTDELVKLAATFGIDIPFGLERIFIIEELLELTLDDENVSEENMDFRSDFPEAAALPRQYNISYIEVMIRDPLWAFVFWEIKGHDREVFEKSPDFEGYHLRVIPLRRVDESSSQTTLEDSFTVPIESEDSAWYLGFPPAEGYYRVELCAQRGGAETVITVSRAFKLPRLIEPPDRKAAPGSLQAVYLNPLSCLSGAKDFLIIRNADRRSKVKGQ